MKSGLKVCSLVPLLCVSFLVAVADATKSGLKVEALIDTLEGLRNERFTAPEPSTGGEKTPTGKGIRPWAACFFCDQNWFITHFVGKVKHMHKLLFTFDGRISRKQYWLGVLCIYGSFAILVAILYISGAHDGTTCSMLIIGYCLAQVSGLALAIKRLHDMNKSGWWVIPISLIGIIPLFGPIAILLIYGAIPGTAGNNQYGLDPLKSQKD